MNNPEPCEGSKHSQGFLLEAVPCNLNKQECLKDHGGLLPSRRDPALKGFLSDTKDLHETENA